MPTVILFSFALHFRAYSFISLTPRALLPKEKDDRPKNGNLRGGGPVQVFTEMNENHTRAGQGS